MTVPFNDLIQELMMEQSEPTYETLTRWQKRYPQYRDTLAEFFAIWAVQSVSAAGDEPDNVPLDKERIVSQAVQHGLDIAERQGRLVPESAIQSLKPFDQLVLTAIHLLHGEGYSVSITRNVSEMAGREVLLGSTYVSLGRLERSGLISAWVPESDPEGKSRQYWTVTLAGERALARAADTATIVAEYLGGPA